MERITNLTHNKKKINRIINFFFFFYIYILHKKIIYPDADVKKRVHKRDILFFLLWITEKVFLSLKSHIWRRKKKRKERCITVLDCKRNKNNKKKTFPFFFPSHKNHWGNFTKKKKKRSKLLPLLPRRKKINRKKMCL